MGASARSESSAPLGMLTVETQIVTIVTFYPIQKYRLVSYNFPGNYLYPFHAVGVPCLRLKFLVWKKPT